MHYLPLATVITLSLILLPALTVWQLEAQAVTTSLLVLIAVAVVLSLALSLGGGAVWARRASSDDLTFQELMLWGWWARWRAERHLADATDFLAAADTRHPRHRTLESLEAVAAAFEAQDEYLDGHSRRVARHSAMVARRLGLAREDVAQIRAAAAVHDIGKLAIPVELLDKPGALTDEEFAVMRRHPDEGARLVAMLGHRPLTRIVRHHHERIDGAGYPLGLAGEEIPLGARIVAVADTFDAVTSRRPYRAPFSHRDAIVVLRQSAGTQLDADAVEAFIRGYAGRRAVLIWSGITAALQGTLMATGKVGAAVSREASRVGPLGAIAAVAAAIVVIAADAKNERTAASTPPHALVQAAQTATGAAPAGRAAAAAHMTATVGASTTATGASALTAPAAAAPQAAALAGRGAPALRVATPAASGRPAAPPAAQTTKRPVAGRQPTPPPAPAPGARGPAAPGQSGPAAPTPAGNPQSSTPAPASASPSPTSPASPAPSAPTGSAPTVATAPAAAAPTSPPAPTPSPSPIPAPPPTPTPPPAPAPSGKAWGRTGTGPGNGNDNGPGANGSGQGNASSGGHGQG